MTLSAIRYVWYCTNYQKPGLFRRLWLFPRMYMELVGR